MRDSELKNIAGEIKTPAYIFSAEDFRRRAEETGNILGPDIALCYSMKANPALLKVLPDAFSAVEVCSPGELEICIAQKIDPQMIIYSGLNKQPEDVARALGYGVGTITAESLLHLQMIDSCAMELGKKANVLIRIAAQSQFGIDRKEALQIIAGRDRWEGTVFAGLHFFTGTQKRKPKEILKELQFLGRYLDELQEQAGYCPQRIEYGTGCPAYLFHGKETGSVQEAEEAEMAFLSEIAAPLQELAARVQLTVEMGRFFAASCGYYCTQIVDCKENDGARYAVIDGGSHQIRYFGQMQGMQIPFITHVGREDSGEEPQAWTIAGSLCTTADVLARGVELTGVRTGDTLFFRQAGAYAVYEGMSLFLSRDLPRLYIYQDEKPVLIRDRIDTYSITGAL